MINFSFISSIVMFKIRLGGNAFSALTTDALAVGASTAVFGLSGSYVAFIILNT